MAPLHPRQQLTRIVKSRWALSSVVTTLIILVISVLLASVVTYFAINVTSTRVQEESLALAKQHVWYDAASQTTQAAIMIINSGGRDIVLDRLTVRGQECAWSKVLYFVTSESISSDLFYNSTLIDGGSIYVGVSNHVFKQATNDITLQSGKTVIIYMSNPDSISVGDIGLTVPINIFTAQAMYYKETNVQGAGGTAPVSSVSPTESPSSDVQILYAIAYSPGTVDSIYQEIGMVVTNTGSSSETFTASDFLIEYGAPDNIVDMYANILESDPTSSLPYYGPGFAEQVQGITLNIQSSITIAPGETGIIYFALIPTEQTLWEPGRTFEVQLILANENIIAQTATVHIQNPI
jgi:hypothetical protein